VASPEFDQVADAMRRTRMASERTYLAWWRTGLAALAVSLAAGRLIPELSSGASWPFEVIGVSYAVVGIAVMVYAYVRQRQIEAALSRDEDASLEPGVVLVFAVAGALLGALTIVLVLAH
jgi:putative membrane protein